jgi:hypothetical protein
MSEANDLPSSETAAERRAELRVPASTLGEVSSRLVGGSDLTLMNYTSRSLYGQSPSRLLVGARISVRLATATLNAVVAGRVVRSSLTQLVGGSPRYEIAVQLERDVEWGGPAEVHDVVPASAPQPAHVADYREAVAAETADGGVSR